MTKNHEEKVVKEDQDTCVEMTDVSSTSEKDCSLKKGEIDVVSEANKQLAQGKRNLVVNDIAAAVSSLETACALFAEKFGETADECGESYYCYGSALLELARLETGVIGVGEDESNDLVDESVEESVDETVDGLSGSKVNVVEKESTPLTNGHVSPKKDEDTAKRDESNLEENAEAEENDLTVEEDEAMADPADEEIGTLQLAWEILELAKNIFYRQSKKCPDMENKLSETYLKLGEVSLESENYTQSIEDLCQCLFIRQKNLSPDDRKIAEVHYQLGNSYQFDKQYMNAHVQYNLALKVLSARISNLKNEKSKADDKVTEEIVEIEKILPEIKEKINDMQDIEKDVKTISAVSPRLVKAIRNTARAVSSLATEMMDSAQAKVLEFGEGSSSKMETEALSLQSKTSPTKATTNISHLVKRKVVKTTTEMKERDSLNGKEDSPKAVPTKSPKKVKVDAEPVLTNGTTTNGEAHD